MFIYLSALVVWVVALSAYFIYVIIYLKLICDSLPVNYIFTLFHPVSIPLEGLQLQNTYRSCLMSACVRRGI